MRSGSAPMARAVLAAYRRGEEDEALAPLVLVDHQGAPIGRVARADSVVFSDIRGEREVELSRAFVEPGFDCFAVPWRLAGRFVTMVSYSPRLPAAVAFPAEGPLTDTLADVVSRAGLRQVRIAESEKAVHVGYFLGGKRAEPVPGEERVVVPSPPVADYTRTPAMSAARVAAAVDGALARRCYGLIIANFANVDVLGHIVNERAIRIAVETADRALGRVAAACRRADVPLVVTADHGTVERWRYPDGTIDTGHTTSPVPFLLADDRARGRLRAQGELADVAPTILALLGLRTPAAMSGRSLVRGIDRTVRTPVVLVILDGWGHAPGRRDNLIARAATPVFDRLKREFPVARLAASGLAVGLPRGTVGNSEAGHLHLGAGRRVISDRLRIDRALADRSFFANPVLRSTLRAVRARRRALHLLGIVSFYSSHGSLVHLEALVELARRMRVRPVWVHAILGRRGERPEAGARYIARLERRLARLGLGAVVSVIGRHWALDREENWDRVARAYDLLVAGHGRSVPADDRAAAGCPR